MLIGQVTDIHLGFEPGNPAEFNNQRLDQVIAHLHKPTHRPDLLVATGDLADRGDADSYRRLRDAARTCAFPIWPCLGNHDQRDPFAREFPEFPLVDGFLQYEVALDGLRLLVLDTLEEGRHGGAFCDNRAAWLDARLAERPDVPVIIAMHHPPLEVGIEWMNTHPEEPWVRRFTEVVSNRPQVKAIMCGHLHRPISCAWNGITVSVCPSSAPRVALDLSPIDPDHADGRPMILADPPAFALHRWNGRELVSHFDTAQDHVVLARFDETMQPLVQHMMHERPA